MTTKRTATLALIIIGTVLTLAGVIVGLYPIKVDGTVCGSFLGGGADFYLIDGCDAAKDDRSALFFVLFLPGIACLSYVALDLVSGRRKQKAAPPSV